MLFGMKSNSCTHSIILMKQQYHVAKRTKDPLDCVPQCCLYTALNRHLLIATSHLCSSILLSCKATKNLCPTRLPPLTVFKGTPSYLPSFECTSALCFVMPLFSPRSHFILPLTLQRHTTTFFKQNKKHRHGK